MDVILAVDVWASEDQAAWRQVQDGTWVDNVRYMKIRGTVMNASPLDEITVSAGKIILDVPDIKEKGTITITGGSGHVTLTKDFHEVTFATAGAVGSSASAYIIKPLSASGFDVGSNDSGSVEIWWEAKGY